MACSATISLSPWLKRGPLRTQISCPLSSLASYNMALWSMLAPLTVKSTCSLPSHHLRPTPFQLVPLQVRVIVAFTWKPSRTDLTLTYGCHPGQKQTKESGSTLASNKPASFVGSLCRLKMSSCHNPLWFESIIPVWIGSHPLSLSLKDPDSIVIPLCKLSSTGSPPVLLWFQGKTSH